MVIFNVRASLNLSARAARSSIYTCDKFTGSIAESRQLFAHVLRGRVRMVAEEKTGHVELMVCNLTQYSVSLVLPEATVWEQQHINGIDFGRVLVRLNFARK